tara:strand:- start:786 stop:1007 length:222 start_codon:yes stop_codon:yes gene_type:complete
MKTPPPPFNFLQDLRNTRDIFLKESDWTQVPDSPLSDSKKAEWATYRQTLRDMPGTYSSETDPLKVVWPDKPE